jgi:hypothetical protein
MIPENVVWQVYCDKNLFNQLSKDERFLGILNLSRITNAIYFCQISAISTSNEISPSNSRQNNNALLYANAILFEGIKCAKFLGKYYSDTEEYINGFSKLFNNNNFKILYNTYLKNLRNKLTFHFDIDAIRDAISDFSKMDYTFATGLGDSKAGSYFNMADEIALHYLIRGQNSTDEELKKQLSNLLSLLGDVVTDFTNASEDLIAACLKDFGFKMKFK